MLFPSRHPRTRAAKTLEWPRYLYETFSLVSGQPYKPAQRFRMLKKTSRSSPRPAIQDSQNVKDLSGLAGRVMVSGNLSEPTEMDIRQRGIRIIWIRDRAMWECLGREGVSGCACSTRLLENLATEQKALVAHTNFCEAVVWPQAYSFLAQSIGWHEGASWRSKPLRQEKTPPGVFGLGDPVRI